MSVDVFTPFAVDLVTGHVVNHASWVDPENKRASFHLLASAIKSRSGGRVKLDAIEFDRIDRGVVDVALSMGSSKKYNVEISVMCLLDDAAEAAIRSFQT